MVKNLLIFLFMVSYFHLSFCHLVLPFGIYLCQVFNSFFPSPLFCWAEQANLIHSFLIQLTLHYLEQPMMPSSHIFLPEQIILEYGHTAVFPVFWWRPQKLRSKAGTDIFLIAILFQLVLDLHLEFSIHCSYGNFHFCILRSQVSFVVITIAIIII